MAIEIDALSSCCGSLDADLIDMNNLGDLEDAFYVAASNVCQSDSIDILELKLIVDKFISGVSDEFVYLLCEVTNVDWMFDQETISLLRIMAIKFKEGISLSSMKQA